MKFFDHFKNEIEVGDFVAVSMIKHRSAEMRHGKVLELIEKTGKVRIEWFEYKFYGSDDSNPISSIDGYPQTVWDGTYGTFSNGRQYKNMVATGNMIHDRIVVLNKVQPEQYRE